MRSNGREVEVGERDVLLDSPIWNEALLTNPALGEGNRRDHVRMDDVRSREPKGVQVDVLVVAERE